MSRLGSTRLGSSPFFYGGYAFGCRLISYIFFLSNLLRRALVVSFLCRRERCFFFLALFDFCFFILAACADPEIIEQATPA